MLGVHRARVTELKTRRPNRLETRPIARLAGVGNYVDATAVNAFELQSDRLRYRRDSVCAPQQRALECKLKPRANGSLSKSRVSRPRIAIIGYPRQSKTQ